MPFDDVIHLRHIVFCTSMISYEKKVVAMDYKCLELYLANGYEYPLFSNTIQVINCNETTIPLFINSSLFLCSHAVALENKGK